MLPGAQVFGPEDLFVFGNLLFFTNDSDHPTYGYYELWATNGLANGSYLVKDFNPGTGEGNASYFTLMGNTVYFQADDGVTGSELWILPDSGFTQVNGEIYHPTDYSLGQNYPNPFNPATRINYQIPEVSFVTLKVYDVLGNEIETLVNEEKPAGQYEVNFDSHSGEVRNLPSGIYFYKIQAVPTGRQAGSFVDTRKMTLLK